MKENFLIRFEKGPASKLRHFTYWIGPKPEYIDSSASLLIYLIAQIVGSALLMAIVIIFFAINPRISHNTMIIIISLTISLKLGASPFQYWVPWTINNISWIAVFWLLTIQKLPIILVIENIFLSSTLLSNNHYLLIIISTTALSGAVIGLHRPRLLTLLAYSSINHLAWLILSTTVSTTIIWTYFAIYSITLIIISSEINNYYNTSPIPSSMPINVSTRLILLIILFVLSRIPPSILFNLKASLIAYAYSLPYSFILIPLLLIATMVTAAYYWFTALDWAYLSTITIKLQWTTNNTSLFNPLLALIITLIGPITILTALSICTNSLTKTGDFHLPDSSGINVH